MGKAGVEVVLAVLVLLELVGGPVDHNRGVGGAVGHRPDRGPEAGAVLPCVVYETGEPEHDVGAVTVTVGDVDAQEGGPKVAHPHTDVTRGQLVDVRLMPVLEHTKAGRLDHLCPFCSYLRRRTRLEPCELKQAKCHKVMLTYSQSVTGTGASTIHQRSHWSAKR